LLTLQRCFFPGCGAGRRRGRLRRGDISPLLNEPSARLLTTDTTPSPGRLDEAWRPGGVPLGPPGPTAVSRTATSTRTFTHEPAEHVRLQGPVAPKDPVRQPWTCPLGGAVSCAGTSLAFCSGSTLYHHTVHPQGALCVASAALMALAAAVASQWWTGRSGLVGAPHGCPPCQKARIQCDTAVFM